MQLGEILRLDEGIEIMNFTPEAQEAGRTDGWFFFLSLSLVQMTVVRGKNACARSGASDLGCILGPENKAAFGMVDSLFQLSNLVYFWNSYFSFFIFRYGDAVMSCDGSAVASIEATPFLHSTYLPCRLSI